MRKILIFGNIASGKTTLAQNMANRENLGHLDLDRVAWEPSSRQRNSLELTSHYIADFTSLCRQGWIIEGCYTDLLNLISPAANEVIFLDLPIEQCLHHITLDRLNGNKPSGLRHSKTWEQQHELVASYINHQDPISQSGHNRFFNAFVGKKQRLAQC